MSKVKIFIGGIQLPVVEPTFQIEDIHNNEEHQVVGFGGVNLVGKKALRTFNYTSFYPEKYDSSFCNVTNLLKPIKFVNKILKIKNGTNITRLIIPVFKVNALYSIEGFSFKPMEGTNDIEYSISMREYRLPTVASKNYSFDLANATESTTDYAKETKTIEKQYYVVKEGDTICTLARKFNMTVSVLYNDNKETIGNNPSNIIVGQKLWIRGDS